MPEKREEEVIQTHEYTVGNFALALPFLDLSRSPEEVLSQLRGVASYQVFKDERGEVKNRLKNINLKERLKPKEKKK